MVKVVKKAKERKFPAKTYKGLFVAHCKRVVDCVYQDWKDKIFGQKDNLKIDKAQKPKFVLEANNSKSQNRFKITTKSDGLSSSTSESQLRLLKMRPRRNPIK